MNIAMLTLSFVVSLLITLYLIPRILLASVRKHLVDRPNARKVHTCTSSRLGGVAFFPSIFFSISMTVCTFSFFDAGLFVRSLTFQFVLVMCACLLLYLVGVGDDVAGIRYRQKFVFQFMAAFLVIASGTWINNLSGLFGIHMLPAYAGIPLTVFLIILVVNALNLIDGIDGLASGLGIMITLVSSILYFINGQTIFCLLSVSTLGTLIAFFYFNFFGISNRKYKIFMGDSGSLLVGFIVSILMIHLCQSDATIDSTRASYQFVIAYSLLIVPCFDVVRVVLHRCKEGKPLFSPDKNHIHHKFLALGCSHRQALALILGIACAFILINLLLHAFININLLFVLDILLWTGLNIFITRKIVKCNVTMPTRRAILDNSALSKDTKHSFNSYISIDQSTNQPINE